MDRAAGPIRYRLAKSLINGMMTDIASLCGQNYVDRYAELVKTSR